MPVHSSLYPLYPQSIMLGVTASVPLEDNQFLKDVAPRLERAKKNGLLTKGRIKGNIVTHDEIDVKNTEVRRVDHLIMDTNIYSEFYRNLADVLIYYNHVYFRYNITHIEPAQYCEYNEIDQGFYDLHMDQSTYTEKAESIRKIAFSIAMNDSTEYEGGELEFKPSRDPGPIYKEGIKFGNLTIFHPNIPHKVHPVTKGIRKAIVGWVHGPVWR